MKPKLPKYSAIAERLKVAEAQMSGVPKYHRVMPYKMVFPQMTVATPVYSALGLALTAGGTNKKTGFPFRGLIAVLNSHNALFEKSYRCLLPSISKKAANPYSTTVMHKTKRRIGKLNKFLEHSLEKTLSGFGYSVEISRSELVAKLNIGEPLKEIYISSKHLSPVTGALIEAIATADKINLACQLAVREKKFTRDSLDIVKSEIQSEFNKIYSTIAGAAKNLPEIDARFFAHKLETDPSFIKRITNDKIEKLAGGIVSVVNTQSGEQPLYF